MPDYVKQLREIRDALAVAKMERCKEHFEVFAPILTMLKSLQKSSDVESYDFSETEEDRPICTVKVPGCETPILIECTSIKSTEDHGKVVRRDYSIQVALGTFKHTFARHASSGKSDIFDAIIEQIAVLQINQTQCSQE